ncbi:MAG: DNA alkylation repair protein, partial [Bacteroidetes bacterium]|nr:DNA alkylation repair protein [Bacteroidota bacterium]
MPASKDLIETLFKIADSKIAEHSARFFKSGEGEYGEGDRFLGVRVPKQRAIAKKHKDLPFEEIIILLESPFHEVRLTGVFILVYNYQKAKKFEEHQEIYR